MRGKSLGEVPTNSGSSGPHNKVEGGFQVGDAFIADEIGGLPREDTPCISGVAVTVRGLPGDDMPVRRLLHDLFADEGGAIVTNVTDRISDEDAYAGNERRIRRDAEQGCAQIRFGGSLTIDRNPTPTTDGG